MHLVAEVQKKEKCTQKKVYENKNTFQKAHNTHVDKDRERQGPSALARWSINEYHDFRQ